MMIAPQLDWADREIFETARRIAQRAARGRRVSEICHVAVTNIKQKQTNRLSGFSPIQLP
jgi:hypothetical protein